MSITLPQGLAAERVLRADGLDTGVAGPGVYARPRPLRIVLVNLMPDKPTTELQFARLLGATSHHVDLTLCLPGSHRPKTASTEHLEAFYKPWSEVRHREVDGLIVTGAPVERLPFEAVGYWRELTEIFEWTSERVHRSLYICWAAQAALYHFHGVPKHLRGEKAFGVFRHRVHDRGSPLVRGFGGEFVTPVARHTEVRTGDLPRGRGLRILASARESGLCLIDDPEQRATYMFNHLEYDTESLKWEYLRDVGKREAVGVPRHYFPGDDPTRAPSNTWRGYARLLFRNWLDEVHEGASLERDAEPVMAPCLPAGRSGVSIAAQAA